MNTTAQIGTLKIAIDDASGAEEIVTVRNVVLSFSVDIINSYSPSKTADLSEWTAEGDFLDVDDSDAFGRALALQMLEDAAFNQTLLDIEFENLSGSLYQSDGYVSRYGLGGDHSAPYSGGFSIQGANALILIEPS